jgi:hypothetical protein
MQFIRQIGATLGLAVLGSILAQTYKENVVRDIPSGLLSRMPAAARSALDNPLQLFSGGGAEQIAKHLPNIPGAQQAFQTVLDGVRLALAQALHTTWWYSFLVGLVAVAISLLLREIPLRKQSDWATRQAARSEAGAEPVAI